MDWLQGSLDGTTILTVATVVTAIATAVLGYATWVLARETKVLSRATSQAHVTATIERNLWSFRHADLVVSNSGNAVAYDIEIEFEPPLPEFGECKRKNSNTPIGHVSALRPNAVMQSNLCDFRQLSGNEYLVAVKWKTHPKDRKTEALSYKLDMRDYEDISQLGSSSPFTDIAQNLKHIREDWRGVAHGNKSLKANVFTSADREREAAEREEWFNQQMRQDPES